jgi:peptidylprolyl isomerase
LVIVGAVLGALTVRVAELLVDHVIPGWTEGMQLMVEGETTRFWIPQSLAYQGKQPPFGMLVFDVQLIHIQ